MKLLSDHILISKCQCFCW
uniref:Uncharacterized protein n=1 Tax=Arundo donax TaxID=35708 RepID=A0A0A8ZAR6_ARUDO